MMEELEVNKKISHFCILDAKDVLEDDNFYYIISEYCDSGDLLKYLMKHEKVNEKLV